MENVQRKMDEIQIFTQKIQIYKSSRQSGRLFGRLHVSVAPSGPVVSVAASLLSFRRSRSPRPRRSSCEESGRTFSVASSACLHTVAESGRNKSKKNLGINQGKNFYSRL